MSGRDGALRAAKPRGGKGTLERVVQHFYPLELTCDQENVKSLPQLNPEAPTFRTGRDAVLAAQCGIQDINADTD